MKLLAAVVLAVFVSAANCTTLPNIVSLQTGKTYEQLQTEFPNAAWTSFGSATTPETTGDLENVHSWLLNLNGADCKLWCTDPVAVEWGIKPGVTYDAPIQDVVSCVVLDENDFPTGGYAGNRGLNCLNGKQYKIEFNNPQCNVDSYSEPDKYNDFCLKNNMARNTGKRENHFECDLCPDFEVRFLCPEARVASDPCPTVADLQTTETRILELDTEIRELSKKRSQLVEEEIEESKSRRQLAHLQRAEKKSVIDSEKLNLVRLIKAYLGKKDV